VTLLSAIALGFAAAGLVALVLAGIVTRDPRSGLPIMLELWMAAGLLRLSDNPSWETVSTAAIIVVIRTVVVRGLRSPKSQRLTLFIIASG
jgi:hypothetical protein